MSILLATLASNLFAGELKSVDDFRDAAAKANAVLAVPDWEQTPEAMDASVKDAIQKANKALDTIGSLHADEVTFKNTIVELDDLTYQADLVANRANVIKEATANLALRAAGEEAVKNFQEWDVSVPYRKDVYKSIKAFANTHPKLNGEDEKLLQETLRDYGRAGLDLPSLEREKLDRLRKELAKLGADFERNITKAQAPVVFTKAELDGVPESLFASPGIKTGENAYTVMANVKWQYNLVEENAKHEGTRRKLYVARETLAKDANVPLINQMLVLRNKIALRLGYKSWADFQTEVCMAKSNANAERFIDTLIAGLEPKFAGEIAELQKIKTAETHDPNAKIEIWDWRYYSQQRNKEKFAFRSGSAAQFFSVSKSARWYVRHFCAHLCPEVRANRCAV